MQGVTLGTIGSGALAELFEAELDKVLGNIADPNTDETTKRSITITVTLKPNRDRDVAEVGLACTSKLAGTVKVNTQLYMGRREGRLIAVESDPRQSNLFDAPRPAAVAEFSGRN